MPCSAAKIPERMASSAIVTFGQNIPEAAPRSADAKPRRPSAEDVLAERHDPAPHASAATRRDPPWEGIEGSGS